MLSVDVEELFAYHLVVENGRLRLPPEKGYELGYKQGYKQGLEQGLERGREEGREQGQEQEQQKIVLRLLDKFLPEQVAELSGVPLEKVKAMQEDDKP